MAGPGGALARVVWPARPEHAFGRRSLPMGRGGNLKHGHLPAVPPCSPLHPPHTTHTAWGTASRVPGAPVAVPGGPGPPVARHLPVPCGTRAAHLSVGRHCPWLFGPPPHHSRTLPPPTHSHHTPHYLPARTARPAAGFCRGYRPQQTSAGTQAKQGLGGTRFFHVVGYLAPLPGARHAHSPLHMLGDACRVLAGRGYACVRPCLSRVRKRPVICCRGGPRSRWAPRPCALPMLSPPTHPPTPSPQHTA